MARTLLVKTRLEAEDNASPAVAKAQGSFSRFADFLKSKFVVTLGDVSNLARSAMDRIFDTARLEGQTNALRIELAKQGQSFDEFIGKLDEVARGTVSTGDLIKSSSQALLLGIPADQIARLLEIARASAIATGRSTADAFNDIATGIGRASPMILDNLGLVLKLGPAYDAMARQVGKSAEELTSAEQKTAVLNAVLEAGKSRIEAYGEAQSGLAEAIEQATKAQDDFTVGASKVVSALGTSVAIIVNASAAGWLILAEAVQTARIQWALWRGDLESAQQINEQAVQIKRLVERLDELGVRLGKLRDQQWASILDDGGDAAQRAAEKTARLALGAADTQGRLADMGNQAATTTVAIDATTVAVDDLADSLTDVSTNTRLEIEYQQQLERQYRATAAAAIFTSQAFDMLARSQGRAVAVQGAVEAGGRLILGGTRVLLPGGGSRLTSEPGINGGRFTSAGNPGGFTGA